MSSNKESQNDEVSVLESIYNNDELSMCNEDDTYSGQFNAFTTVPPNFKVIFRNLMDSNSTDKNSICLSYLPPICLHFKLPPDYPEISPPNYWLSCPWLSLYHLARLCRKLDVIWQENQGMAILFNWFNFLKDESLEFLGFTNNVDVSGLYTQWLRSRLNDNSSGKKNINRRKQFKNTNDTKSALDTCSSSETRDRLDNSKSTACDNSKLEPKSNDSHKERINIREYMNRFLQRNVVDILNLLLVYNDDRTLTEFRRSFFPCDICFQTVRGTKCIQFKPCNHVYCSECVGAYFEERIKSNSIKSMPCPAEKCISEASQMQIKEIVGEDLFSRYDSLLLNATLDTMSDIVYCPRKSCQLPVLLELPERVAICPACKNVFCALCRKTYHGINPCQMKSAEISALAKEYENSSGEVRARLELRYGKKELQSLLENYKSTNWIQTNSKSCPSCSTAIEKSDGCNKMVCGKCSTIFCWICGDKLDPSTPYVHYFDLKSKCNNALFQGMPGANDGEFSDSDSDDEDWEDGEYNWHMHNYDDDIYDSDDDLDDEDWILDEAV